LLIEKKLREAKFFLAKMIDHERMAFDDKEPFEFYLSSFLSAGRSVGYYLQHQQKERYGWTEKTCGRWRQNWEETLPQLQQRLIKFMIVTRDVEVHKGGSSHTVGTEKRELGLGTHVLALGTMEVSGPPGVSPAAIIHVPAYYFTIDRAEQKVTEACSDYVPLLERMVAPAMNLLASLPDLTTDQREIIAFAVRNYSPSKHPFKDYDNYRKAATATNILAFSNCDVVIAALLDAEADRLSTLSKLLVPFPVGAFRSLAAKLHKG
jgi:hypothetical protein